MPKPDLSKANILRNVRMACATDSADALKRLGRAIERVPGGDPSVLQTNLFFRTLDPRLSLSEQIEAYAQEPPTYGIQPDKVTPEEVVARAREVVETSSRFYREFPKTRRGLFDLAVTMTCLNLLVVYGDAEFVQGQGPALLHTIEETVQTYGDGVPDSGTLREIVALCSRCEVPVSPHLDRFLQAWQGEFLSIDPEWVEEA